MVARSLREEFGTKPGASLGRGGSPDVPRPIQTTLLDLVRTLSAFSDDERLIVATITSLVTRREVVLRGIYAGRSRPFAGRTRSSASTCD